MEAQAIVLEKPRVLAVEPVRLCAPGDDDVVIEVRHSGISTGTEKLFWSGEMPTFPGMGYPLVPGYEAFGEVVEAPKSNFVKPGDHVFVPGANCYEDALGLFGASSSLIVSPAERLTRIDAAHGASGALLALAATARHAIAGPRASVPDLIVGHGTLGRLLARLTIASGAPAPTVWEIDAARRKPQGEYEVLRPDEDPRRDYRVIFDASGAADLLNDLIGRLAKGGEIVLAGFYSAPLSFAFPPAFMKEARLRVAAEWTADDMAATRALVESGDLRLDDLITHTAAVADAPAAYETAFTDPSCLKMILNWGT